VRPGVEKNFKPQRMLVGEVASTVRMAAIMVVQRWAQVPLAGSQGSSSEMPFVIDPERSSTRSKSAGNWVMLLALLPQFKVDVGFEGEPPSSFKVTLPPVPTKDSATGYLRCPQRRWDLQPRSQANTAADELEEGRDGCEI
jgi:hypothetical protein